MPSVAVFSSDVAVIGAGITGLATAYALRRRGVEFRLFEEAAPGFGQSAGRTRVFRHGHDDPRLVELAVRAYGEWERLEAELGVPLLGRQGVLLCGPNIGERASAFEEAGVRSRMVNRDEQRGALPVLRPPEDEALLDEVGGFIDVRAAVDSLSRAVRDELVPARVFEVAEGGTGSLEVRTSEGLWTAGRAIICAGAQTQRLARGLGLDIPLRNEIHTRATFDVSEPGASLACLLDRSGVHGEVVYASPMPDGRQFAVGLAGDEEPPADQALARLAAYAERALPGVDPDPAGARLCEASTLPWGADAFAVWRAGDVDVLAGANLFKFAPLLGELLANRADELAPENELGRGQTP